MTPLPEKGENATMTQLQGVPVVLGLSGGVDSAVSARLLQQAGAQVTGVFLDTGCPGREDATRAAEQLEIPFLCVDVREPLREKVQQPFVQGYLRGQTPNPCILCNPAVKFPALLACADRLSGALVATGHYARTAVIGGRTCLLRGRRENDQSYMLSGLSPAQLARCVFPLGGYIKTEVRALAARLGLSAAQKPDSMEICFIPDGDYSAFIERFSGALPPGDIVDLQGRLLGRHRGLHHYTLGQRRGLGVAGGRRLFVSRLELETNRLVLSDGADLYTDRLELPQLNWLAMDPPDQPLRCTVRVRHSRGETPATLCPRAGGGLLYFDTPVRAPTPGQTAAVYAGDLLLCAGPIP